MLPVPAGKWPFPTLSLQSLHRCLDPYPGMPPWCYCPFLPRELQPHLRCTKFGTSITRRNATSTTTLFSKRQSFRYVQAPMLASPPGCTYRARTTPYGQPGRLRHAMDWKLPPRTVVSLHDRIGQLSWRDFHPLDCSLVGCNPAGESPAVLVARVEHVAIPQLGVGNQPRGAWCKRPGRLGDIEPLRWVQPGGLASLGA